MAHYSDRLEALPNGMELYRFRGGESEREKMRKRARFGDRGLKRTREGEIGRERTSSRALR